MLLSIPLIGAMNRLIVKPITQSHVGILRIVTILAATQPEKTRVYIVEIAFQLQS